MTNPHDGDHDFIQLGRRAFLQHGTLVLTAAALDTIRRPAIAADDGAPADANAPRLRVGLVTDMHYADKDPAGTRHYRETLAKLAEAATRFQNEKLTLLVELGDFIDAADSVDVEQRYLKTINREFAAICPDRHYVLGNHCVDTLTKDEFLGGVERQRSYYSFDRGGYHFIVLDACFRGDGQPYGRRNFQWTDANIPPAELEWLAADLRATDKPTVVFAHQRLDVNNNHGVRNNAEVRKLFEASGKVRAVLQGHSHQNDLAEIEGVHYCTLVAMVEGSGAENNGYSTMDLEPDGTIRITGFRRQSSRLFSRT